MLRFINSLFRSKAHNLSIHIDGTQDEVFKGIKNTSNWYLFDFHNLIYLYNDKVMDTKYGRSMLEMKCDNSKRLMAYSIENSTEGVWRFEISVHENTTGSVLNLKCWGPRKISHQTFHLRVTDLSHQLEHFKTLVEAKKRMN
jgi:hypothetical protein